MTVNRWTVVGQRQQGKPLSFIGSVQHGQIVMRTDAASGLVVQCNWETAVSQSDWRSGEHIIISRRLVDAIYIEQKIPRWTLKHTDLKSIALSTAQQSNGTGAKRDHSLTLFCAHMRQYVWTSRCVKWRSAKVFAGLTLKPWGFNEFIPTMAHHHQYKVKMIHNLERVFLETQHQ